MILLQLVNNTDLLYQSYEFDFRSLFLNLQTYFMKDVPKFKQLKRKYENSKWTSKHFWKATSNRQ